MDEQTYALPKYEEKLERMIRERLTRKELADLNRQCQRYDSECGECITVKPSKYKTNTIFLIVGASGSGKTTIVSELEKRYGLKSIMSYTTRKPRYENESGHIFVAESDMPQSSEMVAYTYYNANHYWATQQQADVCDLYIVDPSGTDFFKQNYRGSKKYKVIKLTAQKDIRLERMIKRGDSVDQATQRILLDEVEFANFAYDVEFSNDGDIKVCVELIANYILNEGGNDAKSN